MRNRIRRLLPHAAILICNMYVVFFLIDRVNTAMNFIDNRLTKGLLLILCVVTWFNCKTLLRLASRPAQSAPRPRSQYEAPRRPMAADRGYGDYGGYGAPRQTRPETRYGSTPYHSTGSRRPASDTSRYGEERYR